MKIHGLVLMSAAFISVTARGDFELPRLLEICEPVSSATASARRSLMRDGPLLWSCWVRFDWSTESEGYCVCPAQHLHTTGDAKRDCVIYLNGAPTIHCFHGHCREITEATNHKLRSQIGKVEVQKGA